MVIFLSNQEYNFRFQCLDNDFLNSFLVVVFDRQIHAGIFFQFHSVLIIER